MEGLCKNIDQLSDWVGRIACWLLIPLAFFVFLDVILRYLFNHPTIWAWDVNVQILGILVIFGGCYAMAHNAHIGIDVLKKRLSPRKRAFIEVVTYSLFLFILTIIAWEITIATWVSIQSRECYSSYLMPPLYPFKTLVAIGIYLLYLQGIAKLIRSVLAFMSQATGGEN